MSELILISARFDIPAIAAATDTIDYVATSTCAVIIETASAEAPASSPETASTTSGTSTAQ
jgi:hypothetical protein